MAEIIVNSETSLQSAIGDLREAFGRHKYLRVVIRARKRSLDQNAVVACWYAQMERELREDTALGFKCYCKLHHGVPILRAEDAEYREFYDTAIKGLTYEQKLSAMRFLPVTSLMTVDQLTQYMEALKADFKPRGVTLVVEERKPRKARKAA